MKFILIGLAFFTLNSISAQTIISSRTTSLVPGDYATSGTVHLELYDDNKLDLRFESDYLTQSNVYDVHIFLTNNTNYSAPIDTSGLLLVENIGSIAGINYSSGAMTFSLPAGTGIDDFDNVVFVCVQFGQLHWANGVFSPTTGIETVLNSSIKLFPTISSTGDYTLIVGDSFKNGIVTVSDLNGQIVLEKQIQGQNSIPLKVKGNKGVYFIRLVNIDRQKILRVIKQ